MDPVVLKTLLLIPVGAVLCTSGNPAAAAPSPPPPIAPSSVLSSSAPASAATPAPRFVVLTEPVKIKIVYGETVLPAGMKLPVISSDAATVRINYMGETQTIPIGVTRFQDGATEQQSALPSGATVSPVAPTEPLLLPPAAPPGQQPTVSLQWGYDSRMQGGDITMRELESLLFRHCTPAVDLGGYGINIYNGARYLMDADQAASGLGLGGSISSRVKLATPGFPRDSMYYVGYDGMFEGHFNRLYLVTDVAKKVVSIQLVDEHPKGSMKSAGGLAKDTWNTYNFLNTRLRASDAVRVAVESKREGDVIQIETRMYQPEKFRRKNPRYEEIENTKLLIPIPFARIILHCTQIGLSKS